MADYTDPTAEGTIPVITTGVAPKPPEPSDLAQLARTVRDVGLLAEGGLATLNPVFGSLAQAPFVPEEFREGMWKAQAVIGELQQYVILANTAVAEVMGTVGRIYSYASDIVSSDDSVS